jgi:hypothetical protein
VVPSRLVFAGVFALVLAAFVYGVLEDIEVATSWNVMMLSFAGFFVAGGFVVGRWWALWLAPLAWLVFVPTGSAEVLAFALFIALPAGCIGLVVGVSLRRMLRHRSARD